MRVFISYAHSDADTPLAQYLAQRLSACGVGVWMDERSMHAGQRVQKTLEDAVSGCSHAVFLVSRSWLARDWTTWELGQFGQRKPPALLVPVWRRDRADLKIPPELWNLAGFVWREDDRDIDARFWQLYCALTERPPGPSNTWAVQAKALAVPGSQSKGAPNPLPEPRRPKALLARPSLRCDRTPQWGRVDDLATSGANELLLVPGAADQGHDHFLQRVEALLRSDPPRRIVKVEWGHRRRPASREEFRSYLAGALGVEAIDLETALADQLAHQNLILLHECLCSRFLDEAVIAYYTTWLPEWLQAAGGVMNVKCVQPVEWPRESLGDTLKRWVGARRATGDDRPDAEAMLTRVLAESGALLRAVRLADLHDVSAKELEEFCQDMALKPRQASWLRQRIEARRARTANDLFDAIDNYIPEVPDERSIQ